jgi:hypothetical protein
MKCPTAVSQQKAHRFETKWSYGFGPARTRYAENLAAIREKYKVAVCPSPKIKEAYDSGYAQQTINERGRECRYRQD